MTEYIKVPKSNKQASTKAVAFISKLNKQEYKKSTSWEQVFEILAGDRFSLSIGACLKYLDYGIWDNETNESIYSDKFELEPMFIAKEGDFHWPTVYKVGSEWLMKNWRKLHSKKRKK